MIFRRKNKLKTWPKQTRHHELVSTAGKERREREKAEFYWTGRLVEIAEFYWEGRLVAVETRVLLDKATRCCGVLLGWTT